MKILVTGGAGFIGSRIATAYLARGHEVTVLDDLSVGRLANIPPGAAFHRLRVQDRALSELFEADRFDVVNHHAAHISVTESVSDPLGDAETNLIGTINLMTCAVQQAVKAVIFAASGGAMYGESVPPGADETAPLVPESPYGVAKMAAERYLEVYLKSHGIRFISLRYANVYGPQIEPAGETGVITLFAYRLASGLAPVVYGDGEQTRDFVFVDDVVDANVLALDHEGSGSFNIGTGQSTTVNAVLAMMMQSAALPLATEYREARAGEIQNAVRIRHEPPLFSPGLPRTTLSDGLARVYDLAKTTTVSRRLDSVGVLVTGVGYIGAKLVENLVSQGEQVVGLDNLSSTSASALHSLQRRFPFEFVRGSVLRPESIRRALSLLREVDCVYHLAAQASAHSAAASARYTENTNLLGSRMVFEEAMRAGARRIVFGSSMRVYGPCLTGHVSEDRPYGRFQDLSHLSKCYCEKLLEMMAYQTPTSGVSLRLAIVWGVGPVMKTDSYHMTVPNKFCLQTASGETIRVNPDATGSIGFIHVDDAARALEVASRMEMRERYVVANASAEVHTVGELADMVKAEAHRKGIQTSILGEAVRRLNQASR